MQEEISKATWTNLHPNSPHVQALLHHPLNEGCPALLTASHPDPALYTSPGAGDKGSKQNTFCVACASSNSHSWHYPKSSSNFPLPGAKEEAISLPKHKDTSTKADQEQTGSFGRGERVCCLLLLPAPSTPPKNILQSQHRLHSWRMRMSKNSGLCRDRHTAAENEETESHQELVLSISVCPAAVSEAWRGLQTGSHCPCTTAQLFQGCGEVIGSLHCLPPALPLCSSLSVDAPTVGFQLLTGLIGRPSRGNKMFQQCGCIFLSLFAHEAVGKALAPEGLQSKHSR